MSSSPTTAKELMSSPVRSIAADAPIVDAQRMLLRYGHSGLCVVTKLENDDTHPIGTISRREVDLAIHHGCGDSLVSAFMNDRFPPVNLATTLPEIQALMVRSDLSRLPVVQDGKLVGMITRSDVLRCLHQVSLGAVASVHNHDLPARLLPQLWQKIDLIAQLAQSRGWQLYLVGGAVRDLLLAPGGERLLLPDLDLVVDGCTDPAQLPHQAGVELAQAVHALDPTVQINIYGKFQTAALTWHHDPILGSLAIDIATARTEFYPHPAANPEVEASSIRADLYRRDFTINALAIRLTEPRRGELLDFFGGLLDLQALQLRVIHANSAIEDPTRIFRGVRFAVRMGLTLEAQTQAYFRSAIASGVYERALAENPKAPALQTRLKAELKYMLSAANWLMAIEQLNDLGALKCIHPRLKLDRELIRRLQLVSELFILDRLTQVVPTAPLWLIRLELLLSGLAPLDRSQVASNLQLDRDSATRLLQLDRSQVEISVYLASTSMVSQITKFLSGYSSQLLVLMAIVSADPVEVILWQYLTTWSQIKCPISGEDLRELGYSPGMKYKQILDAVLTATLDGEVENRAQALILVRSQFSP